MTDSPTWVQEMLAHLKTNIRFYKKTQFVNLPPAQLAPARFYLASKTCLVHSFSFLQKTCFWPAQIPKPFEEKKPFPPLLKHFSVSAREKYFFIIGHCFSSIFCSFLLLLPLYSLEAKNCPLLPSKVSPNCQEVLLCCQRT